MRGTKENSGFSGPVGRQASAGQIPAFVGPAHHIQREERKRRRSMGGSPALLNYCSPLFTLSSLLFKDSYP